LATSLQLVGKHAFAVPPDAKLFNESKVVQTECALNVHGTTQTRHHFLNDPNTFHLHTATRHNHRVPQIHEVSVPIPTVGAKKVVDTLVVSRRTIWSMVTIVLAFFKHETEFSR